MKNSLSYTVIVLINAVKFDTEVIAAFSFHLTAMLHCQMTQKAWLT